MCKHQQQFGLDVQCSALVLNFNNIFSNGHLYRAGRTMNTLPSQILERYAPQETVMKFGVIIASLFVVCSCTSSGRYRRDLLSNDKNTIMTACYKLGEARDTASIRLLLSKALDPRMSTDLRFKGMCVAYSRLIALRKISGRDSGHRIDQYNPDTAAANFYLQWALDNGYLRTKQDVDMHFH
jgi:hypothetical protein